MYWVVLGYFLLVAGAAALLIFPPIRLTVVRGLGFFSANLTRGAQHSAQFVTNITRASARNTSRTVSATMRLIKARRLAFGAALLVIATPPLLALTLHQGTLFEFAETPRSVDPRIAMLLAGERLSPPPTLTPAVFTTREVELVRPETAWASRNWELLDTDFRQRLLLVIKLMREQYGYELVLLEGYRSPERQNRLAARGKHVTQAVAYQSYHQHGLAADCAFYRDGKLVISERDPWAMRGYQLYGELATAAGLRWGGNWKMQDLGHVELPRPEILGNQTILATR